MLAVSCVVLLCVSFSAARSRKTVHRHTTTKTTTKTTRSTHHSSSHSSHSSHSRTSRKTSRKGEAQVKPQSRRYRGQRGIDDGRAREIQTALIREKYLDGEPSGNWDAQTKAAMLKYQNDNGWQTKVVPDSRALIKLGLGPNHADLINPAPLSDSMPNSARELRPGGALPQR